MIALLADLMLNCSYFYFVYEIKYVYLLLSSSSRLECHIKRQRMKIEKWVLIGVRAWAGFTIVLLNGLAFYLTDKIMYNQVSLTLFVTMRYALLVLDVYVYIVFAQLLSYFILKRQRTRETYGGVFSKFDSIITNWVILLTVIFGLVNFAFEILKPLEDLYLLLRKVDDPTLTSIQHADLIIS